MVNIKAIKNDNVQVKPRYGHLSTLNPEFASFQGAIDKEFNALWELPMDEFVEAWKTAPPALLEDSPVIGRDITVEHMKVPVNDGTLVEIRIYKSSSPTDNAILNFNTHGGGLFNSSNKSKGWSADFSCSGWTVGTHDTEEGQNRWIAAHNKAVVVSVDYRMAPKFKFPFAINDSFDVLKWVRAFGNLGNID